ncbi:hypothetical protein K439DRAFT_1622945 [Ramaria rubella]|nr:hypothetical protein K439DRAFT_1622945 [Ramaria rubella]
MVPSFLTLFKVFQTKVLTKPKQQENLLEEIEMWVKEMEGIDDELSDAMEACLSIQLNFKIPDEVMRIQSAVEAAKSWVSVLKSNFKVALPNPLTGPRTDGPLPKVTPSVTVAPLFSKGALTDDTLNKQVEELIGDDVAIIP